jgi:hypothetical protein
MRFLFVEQRDSGSVRFAGEKVILIRPTVFAKAQGEFHDRALSLLHQKPT